MGIGFRIAFSSHPINKFPMYTHLELIPCMFPLSSEGAGREEEEGGERKGEEADIGHPQ